MKIEHITAVTHHSVVRDTENILLPTRHHFGGALPEGKNPVLIPGTTLSVMLTVDWPSAVFTLFKGDVPLFLNVCCFEQEGRITALDTAKSAAKQMPIPTTNPPTPALDTFIITFPVLPFATPEEMQMCGEIELYLYNAIYERNT